MRDLRTEVAYLLWCMEEGYYKQEDRDGLSGNWMYESSYTLHPDDVVRRAGLLEMADALLAAMFTDQNLVALRKEVERRGVGLTIPQLRVVLEAAAAGGQR